MATQPCSASWNSCLMMQYSERGSCIVVVRNAESSHTSSYFVNTVMTWAGHLTLLHNPNILLECRQQTYQGACSRHSARLRVDERTVLCNSFRHVARAPSSLPDDYSCTLSRRRRTLELRSSSPFPCCAPPRPTCSTSGTPWTSSSSPSGPRILSGPCRKISDSSEIKTKDLRESLLTGPDAPRHND